LADLALAPAPFAHGSYGEVFEAVWAGSTRVAAKVCMLASAEARRDIEGEAAALAALQHPRILRIYGIARLEGGPAGKAALVLQLAEGGSLEGLIQRGGHEALVNGHDSGNTGGSAASAAALLLPAGWQALPKYNCAASDLETKDLIDCAAQGRLGAVKDAIARGARANARLAVNGQTALHCASAAAASADAAPAEAGGGPTAVIKYLLGLGGADAVDAKAVDERGNSALHLAARAGVLTRVEALLPRSDLAARDAEGRTALEALNALVKQGTHTPPEHKRIAELLSRKAPLPPRFIFRMLAGAAEGVAFLHSRGVVHNDLKSANILLDAHLEPLVADLGLAKIAHSTLTQTAGGKGPLGSLAWMAPEQIPAKSAGRGKPPTDVYSLGMIAFELATRTYPWAGLDPASIMYAVGIEKARPELPADVDPRLAALIGDCTKDTPGERPSAAEVAVRARALAEGREASAAEIAAVRGRVAEQERERRDARPRAAGAVGAAEAAAVPLSVPAAAPAPAAPAPAASSPAPAMQPLQAQLQQQIAKLQHDIAQVEAAMRANPIFASAMEPGLKEANEKLALLQQEAELRAQIAQLTLTVQASPGVVANALAPAIAQAQAQLAALEVRGGRTDAEIRAEAEHKAAADKAAREAAARAEAELKAAAEKVTREAAARAEAEHVAKLPQGERDKAARAALGLAEARTKGEQLLDAVHGAWLKAPGEAAGEAAKPFAADALRLISEGADPDCINGNGWSALIFASHYEQLDDVAARLIAAGANLDLVNKTGDSALIWACYYKRVTTALLLVEAGAALNHVDGSCKSALDWARENGLATVAAAIRARGGRTGAELKAHK
jgi:ankyrin repeat protein